MTGRYPAPPACEWALSESRAVASRRQQRSAVWRLCNDARPAGAAKAFGGLHSCVQQNGPAEVGRALVGRCHARGPAVQVCNLLFRPSSKRGRVMALLGRKTPIEAQQVALNAAWGVSRGVLVSVLALAAVCTAQAPMPAAVDPLDVRVPGRRVLIDPETKVVDRCPSYCTSPAHGRCSMDLEEVCQCFGPFQALSADCSEQACPTGRAWTDTPDESGQSHRDGAVCSNAGYCNRATGDCDCDPGFTGDACQRKACPSDCSGKGRCLTMREAAAELNGWSLVRQARYDGWDADMMTGCVCDPGWTGNDCSTVACPSGSDPLSQGAIEIQVLTSGANHVDEVQVISLGASVSVQANEVQIINVFADVGQVVGGSFEVLFDTTVGCSLCGTASTCLVQVDVTPGDGAATALAMELALESCANIDDVQVTFAAWDGVSQAIPKTGLRLSIEFVGTQVGGDVPSLQLIDRGSLTGFGCGVGCVEADPSDCELDGDELSGSIQFRYDDSVPDFDSANPGGSWPPAIAAGTVVQGPGISTAVTIDSTADDFKAALEAIPAIGAGVLSVSKEFTGQAGPLWRVTWVAGARGLGDRAQLTVAATSLALAGGVPLVEISTEQDGTFLSGTFQLGLQLPNQAMVLTGALDWDISEADLEDAIEALDDVLGEVKVVRTQNEAGDSWSGGFDWSVTFRSYSYDLPTFETSQGMNLDADSRAGNTGGAKLEVSHETKHRERQTIVTAAPHVNEVQRIAIENAALAAREVQQMSLYIVGGGPPTGGLRLRLDTTAGCNLCPSAGRADAETVTVDILGSGTMTQRAVALQSDLADALTNLPNVDGIAVTVSQHPSDTSPSATDLGFVAMVTFTGDRVAGSLPLLQVSAKSNLPVAWTTAVTRAVPGDEAAGTLTLTATDSGGYPEPADQTGEALVAIGTLSTAVLSAFATEAQVEAAINALAVAGTVSVSRAFTGGPGAAWDVTFAGGARARGDRPMLLCTGTFVDAGTACVISEVEKGTFLSGTLGLEVSLPDLSRQTDQLAWDASASDVQTALSSLFPDGRLGELSVSRDKSLPTGLDDDWVGGFAWTVSFLSLNANVDEIRVRSQLRAHLAMGTTSGATAAVDGSLTVNGSVPGEVNEIQLLECSCPTTCSGGLRLSWMGHSTGLIAHSSSAADIQAALESLPDIGGVQASIVGGVRMCTAAGSTVGITFTHWPGDAPPLYLEPSDATAFQLASTGGQPRFGIRAVASEPMGDQGLQVRIGRRISRTCSGRGTCNPVLGACECASGTSGTSEYTASNNAGGHVDAAVGMIHNCGAPYAVQSCPVKPGTAIVCSGAGICSGSPEYKCECFAGYSGPACEALACPTHLSWFDEAQNSKVAHLGGAVCSNRGTCQPGTGMCVCEPGFMGLACEAMNCPFADPFLAALEGRSATICADVGNCTTMRGLADHALHPDTGEPLAAASYAMGWDTDKLYGCACQRFAYTGPWDAARSDTLGPSCAQRTCPRGPDPKTSRAAEPVKEVHQILCAASAGAVVFGFRGVLSESVAWDAPVLERHRLATEATSVEGAIRNILSVGIVDVSFASGEADSFSDLDRRLCTTSKGEVAEALLEPAPFSHKSGRLIALPPCLSCPQRFESLLRRLGGYVCQRGRRASIAAGDWRGLEQRSDAIGHAGSGKLRDSIRLQPSGSL